MTDRRSFDTDISQNVQDDIKRIVTQLETTISQRTKDVQAAMSDFQADNVSDDYHHVEQRWMRAADQVQQIIDLVRGTLEKNNMSADTALSLARTAVQNIG